MLHSTPKKRSWLIHYVEAMTPLWCVYTEATMPTFTPENYDEDIPHYKFGLAR
jgi:hypothetical protein